MTININQDDSPYIRFVFEWDTLEKSTNKPYHSAQDIDSGVIIFNKNTQVIDESYYGQLATRDGSIQHRADSIVGGDLIPKYDHKIEQVDVQLDSINHAIQYFCPFLISPSNFPHLVKKVKFSIVQPITKELTIEHYSFILDDLDNLQSNALIIGYMERKDNKDWEFIPFETKRKIIPSHCKNIRDLHIISSELIQN